MECQGGTYAIYSPECRELWRAVGRRQHPDLHTWVEAIGRHYFETPRDLYADVPLNLKVAGKSSSARGHVQLNVSPMDKEWYQDACATVGQMINAPRGGRVELKDVLQRDIGDLDIHQLAHVGQVNVYLNGKRYLNSTGQVPKLPRHASPYKQQHLQDWYEGHRDALCKLVSDHVSDKTQQQVAASLADGGSLERSICGYLEKKASGPAGESWDRLVQTYGIDKLARETDAHRSAQHVSKSLMSALCDMIGASANQINAFYNRQNALRSKQKAVKGALDRANIFNKDQDAAIIRSGIDTDMWADERDMYNEISMDAFDQPAVRDRVVELLHRQPLARKAERLTAARREQRARDSSPLGNPVQEYEQEVHHPYYGTHPVEEPKKTPFYGDYHGTLDRVHLYQGLHPHPMAFMGAETKDSSSSLLVPLGSIFSRKKDKKDKKKKKKKKKKRYFWQRKDDEDSDSDDEYGHMGARLVPLECHMDKKKEEYMRRRRMRKKDEEDSDEDDDEYGHMKGRGRMGARLIPLECHMDKEKEGVPRLVPLDAEEDSDEADDEYGHSKARGRMRMKNKVPLHPRLVPLEQPLHACDGGLKKRVGARLIPLKQEKARLVPLTQGPLPSADELPTFEEMLARMN